MSWDDDLTCRRCGHRADLHGIESGCMVRVPERCDCPATEERVWQKGLDRMTAGLEP